MPKSSRSDQEEEEEEEGLRTTNIYSIYSSCSPTHLVHRLSSLFNPSKYKSMKK